MEKHSYYESRMKKINILVKTRAIFEGDEYPQMTLSYRKDKMPDFVMVGYIGYRLGYADVV